MIYSVFDGKEFSFYHCYVYDMMNRFENDFLSPISIYMRDWGDYIILDTSIYNDEYGILIYEQILKDIIESVIIRSQCIMILSIYWKKRKMIWKSIY